MKAIWELAESLHAAAAWCSPSAAAAVLLPGAGLVLIAVKLLFTSAAT